MERITARRLNPKLQFADRGAYIANHVRQLPKLPYFSRAEQWNLEGAPLLGTLPLPALLPAEAFAGKAEEAVVLDTRTALSFSAAHVPGAKSVWLGGVPMFAGWFLPLDQPILLVTETNNPQQVIRLLVRLGFDDLIGCLAGGMLARHKAGRDSASVQTITPQALRRRAGEGETFWILDIRSDEESAAAPIGGAHHIPVTGLLGRLEEIPKDRRVAISCGMGLRSMVTASLFRRKGWQDLTVVLGGLSS